MPAALGLLCLTYKELPQYDDVQTALSYFHLSRLWRTFLSQTVGSRDQHAVRACVRACVLPVRLLNQVSYHKVRCEVFSVMRTLQGRQTPLYMGVTE